MVVPALFCCSCALKAPLAGEKTNPVIYPPPPAEPRIQFLSSFSTSEDFTGKLSPFREFLFGKEEPRPLVKPYGISVRKPMLYICDTGIRGLEVVDLEKKTFRYFIPGGPGELQLPLNCGTDANGNLYVADGKRNQIVIFDSLLNYRSALTLKDGARPVDLCLDQQGLWVAVIDGHRIDHYSLPDLRLLGSSPSVTAGSPAYLYQPVGIDLRDDRLYVSDIGGCGVAVFDTSYRLLSAFGESGNAYGQFTRPKGIAAGSEGTVLVVDAAFENVQVFDRENRLLTSFGGSYKGPGGLWLPAGICYDESCIEYFKAYVMDGFTLNALVFVVSQYGPGKISVYGFISPSEIPAR